MKVVQINGVASAGSTGKIVTQLSEIMKNRGIENFIIVAGYQEECKADNVFFCSSFWGVRLHQFLGILFGDSGFHSWWATRKLIKYIKRLSPDIVHLHNIYSYFLNVEKLITYLKKNNIRVVWTMHDFWPITGHCTHFEAVGCNRWQTLCKDCPQTHCFPYSPFFDRSKELFLRKKRMMTSWSELQIVTVSAWAKSKIEQSYLKDKRISVIPNGIDLNIFYPDKTERREEYKNKFLILGVSMGWGERKGYQDFLELASLLRDDECIVLIGLTDKQINELPPKIMGIRRTAHISELRKYYTHADVYVSASVEETMGLTVVEAMACGTPAIVYNKTALPELIADGCGYVSEKGSSYLREKIDLVRANGKEAYSQRCIEHVRQNYDKERQYGKYCELYALTMSGNEQLDCL